MNIQYRATLYDGADEWQDSSDGHPSVEFAADAGEKMLLDAKGGWYVDIERIEKVESLSRGPIRRYRIVRKGKSK